MYKKIFSLSLVCILLFNVTANQAFAKKKLDYTGKATDTTSDSSYSDYCKEIPKNAFNQSIDVNCAIRAVLPYFIKDEALKEDIAHVGLTGDTYVHLWKYAGLSGLVGVFDDWLKEEHKENVKYQFIGNLSDKIKKNFKEIETTEESAKVINTFLQNNQNYAKILEITSQDIANWIKTAIIERKQLSNDSHFILKGSGTGVTIGAAAGYGISSIFTWKATTAAAAVATKTAAAATGAGAVVAAPVLPFICMGAAIFGAVGFFVGNYYNEKENAKIDKKLKKLLDKEERNTIKLNVCSSALRHIFDFIECKEWVGNDLLVVKLNFDKEDHSAQIEFRNVGVAVPKSVNETGLFENFSNKLSELMTKYNITKI